MVVVELEGHGREELQGSRSVADGGVADDAVSGGAGGRGWRRDGGSVSGVRQQQAGLAEHGLWYGLVRYLRGGAEEATLAVRPWLSFNYLGQLDQVLGESQLFAGATERLGATRSGSERCWHEVEVNAAVAGGRLEVEWSYGGGEQNAAAVAGMAQEYMVGLRER